LQPSRRKDNYGAAKGIEITAAQGANIVLREPATISELEAGGWFKRKDNGLFDLIEFIHGFRRYQEELKRRGEERRIAPNRIQEARALEIELRTARDAGELVEMEKAIALAQSVAGETRAEFGSLPARITRDLEQRAIIEKEVNESFNRLADKLAREIANIEHAREDILRIQTTMTAPNE
jgi:phage terminase Nu1 subunit (DNA packaging protein)